MYRRQEPAGEDRAGAPPLQELRRPSPSLLAQPSSDPAGLQEDHHLLDRLLLLPRSGDHRRALGAQPRHLHQPRWLLLDYVQRGLGELVHDPLSYHGADPLDQP
jgi:hypothetical protein